MRSAAPDHRPQALRPRMPAVIEPPQAAIGGISATQLEECGHLLRGAQRPVIYAGGGIITSGASDGRSRATRSA